ncbi:MAG: NAD(P)H-hydrate dehydratase [Candidatus Omnitrophica bacterium]|nr:NAD(P)H-hydrate dehydratase [Candidatus Omnitrophota bacterium]MDD5238432.1 NAD(P)H-hydrate dehydratase [Candidatus Omnitrophota bacterium]
MQLLRRNPKSHKGDFGHLFILAGSAKFSGAAVLCAEAAMRSGAGLVTLGIPKSLNNAIIKIKPKEVMTLPLPQTQEGTLSLAGLRKIKDFLKEIDVAVLGPGLGKNNSTYNLILKLLSKISRMTVIDADGLNALVGHLKILRDNAEVRKQPAILTPHPGEMARLLGISINKVQAKRKEIARRFAKYYNCIVVLKGHKTIVADSHGKIYANNTGNPGMATAGSGDVLTGIIGAFLGQGLSAFSATKYAVYLHGFAGDLAAKEKTQLGMIASDIIAKIPEAIKKMS